VPAPPGGGAGPLPNQPAAGAPPLPPGVGGAGGDAAGGPPLAAAEGRPLVKEVPKGQGVLWCVGEDGQDDGGLRQSAPDGRISMPGEDLIFLVPLPPSQQEQPKKPARR
jgi:hypothetical protein